METCSADDVETRKRARHVFVRRGAAIAACKVGRRR